MNNEEIDIQVQNKQKALKNAFYATLIFSGVNLLFVLLFTDSFQVSFLGIFELIAFPLLGYFTKKSSKKATLGLLVLFLIDRLMWVLNWASYVSSPFTVISTIFISFALWIVFYKAYLYLK